MAGPAKEIEIVVRPNGTADFLVDGVEFPWDVEWGSIVIDNDSVTGTVRVSVTMLAARAITRLEDVSVDDDSEPEVVEAETLFPPKAWDVGWEFDATDVIPEYGPPQRVKALESLDNTSDWPILRRTTGDNWAWFGRDNHERFGPADTGGQPWELWMTAGYKWKSTKFRVIEADDE